MTGALRVTHVPSVDRHLCLCIMRKECTQKTASVRPLEKQEYL